MSKLEAQRKIVGPCGRFCSFSSPFSAQIWVGFAVAEDSTCVRSCPLDKSSGPCFSDEGVKETMGPCVPQSPPRSPLPPEASQTLACSKPSTTMKGGGRWFHPAATIMRRAGRAAACSSVHTHPWRSGHLAHHIQSNSCTSRWRWLASTLKQECPFPWPDVHLPHGWHLN
jgi:hypothetical protein